MGTTPETATRMPLEIRAAESGDAPRLRLQLAIVSLLVSLPMLFLGGVIGIDYDGWWHVFIARQMPWEEFWRDVARNAHPPLFYLLLRMVAQLGSERLLYRSLSIVAAVIATYAVGVIAARVLRRPQLSPLCALAFGIAVPTAVMACAVRSYMVSLAFLLVAFLFYLDLIDPSRRQVEARTRIAFALALIGAVVSHYGAIFFLVAALALPALYAAVDGGYRGWLRERLRTHWRAELATGLPIAGVVVVAYALHFSRYREPMKHAALFYPNEGDWAAGVVGGSLSFLARAIVAEIDLFSPLPVGRSPAAIRGAVVLLGAALAAGLAVRLRRRSNWVVASAPLATVVVLGVSMMIAALAGRYPFGGMLRQQYILFPFLMLSLFALIEEMTLRWPSRRLVAIVCATVLLAAAVRWRHAPFRDIDPASAEVAQFDQLFPDRAAVYVDGFSLIIYFAGHQRAAWTTETEVGRGMVALSVREPERSFVVVRDLGRRAGDLLDPQLYRDLRQVMARTALPAIDLFRVRRDAHLLSMPPRIARAELTDAIVRAASNGGMRIERLAHDGSATYARVVPADVTPGAVAPEPARFDRDTR